MRPASAGHFSLCGNIERFVLLLNIICFLYLKEQIMLRRYKVNTKLFRYISFEDFINLTINNKDRFVRPSSWEDKYEGDLFSHMETPEDVHQIVSEMYYNLCPRNYYAIPDNYFRMWHSKWFTYAQCWSKHPETDAM